MATTSPSHQPTRSFATTTPTKNPNVMTTKRNASASLFSGFRTPRSLEDVDGRVHDDPHHVDEVPVDPGDLDAVVVLGRVVAAKRAHRRHREQRETDEDVRAVQAGQAEERR